MKIICSSQFCLKPPLLSTAFLCLTTSSPQWFCILSSWGMSRPTSLWSHTHSCGFSSHIRSAPSLPVAREELLAQSPERESDWLPHHTELSTDWLTAIGSSGPTRSITSAQWSQVTRYKAASDLMECGCGWSYTWLAWCWGLWGGVMAGGMTIPGWTLEICCYHSLGLADVQSDHFPEKSFHAFLRSTLMGPICPSAHRTSLLLHLVASISLISSACIGTICLWNPGQNL